MDELEDVKQTLADEYPEFIIAGEGTDERYFDIAALMQSKGHIE